jgi:hypothetical protein
MNAKHLHLLAAVRFAAATGTTLAAMKVRNYTYLIPGSKPFPILPNVLNRS